MVCVYVPTPGIPPGCRCGRGAPKPGRRPLPGTARRSRPLEGSAKRAEGLNVRSASELEAADRPSQLSHPHARPAFAEPTQRRLLAILHETPRHPLPVARADLQHGRDSRLGYPPLVELALVAVEKDQRTNHPFCERCVPLLVIAVKSSRSAWSNVTT